MKKKNVETLKLSTIHYPFLILRRILFRLSALSLLFFTISFNTTHAICPVCTVAVGAGVGLSRWLGIDDTISGVWVGGLIVSSIAWTEHWLNKKKINFKFRRVAVVIGFYLLVVGPMFFFSDMIGSEYNKLWGIDKLLLGIGTGSLIFLAAAKLHFWLKEKNGNKVYFPFQKVVIPVSSLILLSLVYYFVTLSS